MKIQELIKLRFPENTVEVNKEKYRVKFVFDVPFSFHSCLSANYKIKDLTYKPEFVEYEFWQEHGSNIVKFRYDILLYTGYENLEQKASEFLKLLIDIMKAESLESTKGNNM